MTEEESAHDLFLAKLAALDDSALLGAPPGCAPMRKVPVGETEPAANPDAPDQFLERLQNVDIDSAPPPGESKPSAQPTASAPSEQPPADAGVSLENPEEALDSKVWKDRKNAYEFLEKTFSQKKGFDQFAGKFEQIAAEKNGIAQKSAAKALTAFFKHGPEKLIKNKFQEIVQGTAKNLGGTAKMQLAEMWLVAVEAVPPDMWLKEIIEASKQKARKVPGQALGILHKATTEFGIDIFDDQEVVNFCIDCLGKTDKDLKKGAQNVLVNAYYVMGEGLEEQLEDKGVKSAVQKLLKKEFKKVAGKDPPSKKRYRRGCVPQAGEASSEKKASAKPKKTKTKSKASTPKKAPARAVRATDIFKMLLPDFEEQIQSAVWKEKKAALDDFLELAEDKKTKAISKGARFDAAIQGLKACLEHKNANVISTALKVANVLSEKMTPKDFKKTGDKLIPVACFHWKEKRMATKSQLDKLLLSYYQKHGVKLSVYKEQWVEATQSKLAVQRLNCAQFLLNVAKCEEMHGKLSNQVDDSDFIEGLRKLCLKESDGKVRGAAAEAIAHITGATGSGKFNNLIDDFREDKKGKTMMKKMEPILKDYASRAPPEPEEVEKQ